MTMMVQRSRGGGGGGGGGVCTGRRMRKKQCMRSAVNVNGVLERRKMGGRKRGESCKAKKDIHPEFHTDAKVYCNGQEVFTVGGCEASYDVDIWSGNHPAFMTDGSGTAIVDDELINKFTEKFGDMGEFGAVDTQTTGGQDALKKFKEDLKKNKQNKAKKR